MQKEYSQPARSWGVATHLAALIALFGIPFGNIIGPLVVWLIKKHEYPFVEEQGRNALNFQISWTIYKLIAIVLIIFIIGLPILMALILVNLVLVIIAAINASNGHSYQYPLTIKFIK